VRLKHLLEPDGWELVRKKGTVTSDKPVEAEAMDLVVRVGEFVEDFRKRIEDGEICKHDELALEKGLAKMECELAEIRASIKNHRLNRNAGGLES